MITAPTLARARPLVHECLALAASYRTMGDRTAAREWISKARSWREHGARELVANRVYVLARPDMVPLAMQPAPLNARPLSVGDAAALFHAGEHAWSAALATHYGKPGSNAYDRGRYRTAHGEWPEAVRVAYDVRAEACAAWHEAIARGRTPTAAMVGG